jgi:adenylate cyclase class IV
MADKHSEVEVKFDGTGLEVGAFLTYIGMMASEPNIHLDWYKQVNGDDSYYQQGDNILRHRYDGQRRTSVLTVKQRKSAESTNDRKEVDLFLREDMTPGDVQAFLQLTGWTQVLPITKMSYIAMVTVKDGSKTYKVCLALYDVMDLSVHEGEAGWDRYLEAEIEKDSECTHEEALAYLDKWVEILRADLTLGPPMNKSLFEIYRPKNLLPAATIKKLVEQDDLVAAIVKDRQEKVDQFVEAVAPELANGRCME